uniref:Protein NipSnap n=2 Tax=Culex pipiens TaxID=7175 RepID=A0A8D8AFP5_CULPI
MHPFFTLSRSPCVRRAMFRDFLITFTGTTGTNESRWANETSKTLITSSFILARRGETVFIRSSRSLSRRTISFRDQQFNPAFRANSPKKTPSSCCFSTQSDPPSKSSPVFAMTSVTFRLGKAFHVPLVRNLATTSALARDGSSESWLSKLLVRKIEPTKESHSRMLSDKEIIYELHTHNIRPDSVGKYLENYKKSVEIVSSKKDLTIELIGSWSVDVGDLDQCLHLWRYTGGFEMVDQSKKVLCSDPDYVQLTQERGTFLRSRHLQYLLAFSYWPQLALRQDKNIYEIRSYRLKPGTMIEWGNNWARAINYRQNNDEAFAGFFSQIGRLYNVHHIWCYKDLLSRKETRESAWRSPGWDECVAYTVPLIREMHTRILTPTDFSPTQ